MALINKLEAIGDAIREKTGETDKLTLEDMVETINSMTAGGGTLQTAVITSMGANFFLDNYVDVSAGDNFILFYTVKMSSGGDYLKAIHMPTFGKYIYTCSSNIVNTNALVTSPGGGIKFISTDDINYVDQAMVYKNSAYIDEDLFFNDDRFYYSSNVGCDIGTTAILIYAG